MSFASLRKVLRSARKGLCSTCSRAKYPQLEAAGAGHVGCLIYTFETLGQMVRDEHDVTAMHVAARKGHISILIYIIENNLAEDTPRAKNGATPAHDAAGTGTLECLRYLLSHTKARASDIDQNNATPLHWAVQSGHTKIVQWLVVEMHASIDSVAKNGVTPLHVAAARDYSDILRWITGYAYKNHPKPRRLVNAKDKNGATPVYHAAHAGHTGIIRWLAEKGGGDPTIISNQGLGPLHAATIAGNLEAVKYLFQFGLATAPGGLRTTEGACALHFAASEGHVQISKWLMQQKECTGNERDYYQSTPLHDAAEHGQLKILQLLCEEGANCTLTDVEGNSPQDLAEKNGQHKCAKFLASFRKNKRAQKSNGAADGGHKLSRGLSRSKHSKAEMIDSYRNAPPHQLPVNAFEDEDEDLGTHSGDEQWTTLRDLMGEKELGEVAAAEVESMTEEQQKRWKLEEDMRREREERRQKRRVLLQREEEYEKEIRERLLAEEMTEQRPRSSSSGAAAAGAKVKKRKKSDPVKPNLAPALSQLRRLSLPVNLGAEAELTQRGLVEQRKQEFELRTPKGKKSLLKLLSRKSTPPIRTIAESQSWDSQLKALGVSTPYEMDDHDYYFADEEDLPEPPPLPTVEYLLGKRPVNLRKRASETLKQQIQQKMHMLGTGAEDDSDGTNDSDDRSSVGSAKSDNQRIRRKKSAKRKKKKTTKDDVNWKYSNSNTSGSPQRTRRDRERHPTPIPPQPKSYFLDDKMPVIQLDFDAVFEDVEKELSKVQSSLSNEEDTPSSLSPLYSPSPHSPLSPPGSIEASPIHSVSVPAAGKQPSKKDTTAPVQKKIPKRAAPKLPAHLKLKNKQQDPKKASSPEKQRASAAAKKSKPSPIAKILSSRGKSNQPPKEPQNNKKVAKSPTDFMAALKRAISSSPPQPRIMRQHGVSDNDSSSQPGRHSPTMDEIESEIKKMESTLSQHPPKGTQQRPPSPTNEESDTDTDTTDNTSSSQESSSSDTDDSSTEDSSDSEEDVKRPAAPKRPVMARNIGMSGGARERVTGFNRARMLARYPRLLRRKIIRLDTIVEQAEEKLHAAETSEEKAVIFFRIVKQKKAVKAWRKYMQIMRSAYRRAEKMAVRKRRDMMAKAFYKWIQVRNMAAVTKDGVGRAKLFYKRRLMKRVFSAWLFSRLGTNMPIARSASLQLISAEDTYLEWLNRQLASTGRHVDDISESLRDGILIIKAIAIASGQKPPKYNANPKVRLHCQDNWKMAHEFMKIIGINMKGIEPADLANILPAAIHNMFNNVLKWYESSGSSL